MVSQIEAGNQPIRFVLTDIEQGQIRIPRFQRDFVWSVDKAAALIDSIIKGYPIGSVILWRTSEKLRDVRSLGRIQFSSPMEGEKVNYILDGQQRMTSLFAALHGAAVTLHDGALVDFSKIYVDLTAERDEQPICTTEYDSERSGDFILLTRLFKGGASIFQDFDSSLHDAIDRYRRTLDSYPIPNIKLIGSSISVATEVFSRINTGGQSLSVFEIMVAKTYEPERDFDLLSKWEAFKNELNDSQYGTIEPISMLQLIALIIEKDCRRETILNLSRTEFINHWGEAEESIRCAVGFLKSTFRIPASRIVPYISLLVIFSYFFYINNFKRPNHHQLRLLKDFFWRTAWESHYSSATETKLSQDVSKMSKIRNSEQPVYEFRPSFEADWLRGRQFRASDAFSKTILCVLAAQSPQAFDDGSVVNLRNDAMRRADSSNFHHFFPKAYLKRQKREAWEANIVFNITFVDDYLNKYVIRDKKPSKYMEEFQSQNSDFDQTMQTHLIATDEHAPIWRDDYDQFIDDRMEAVVLFVKKQLVKAKASR